ncbi:MAG: LacI family transcriptional regulator [Lentisphaerae bacterium]|nr:MAG: LacI family transcriptional regulator [Lentisphaerota bacterium]
MGKQSLMKNKRATMYDVAKKAGVSISTVSLVFNNSSTISPDTVKTVKTVANSLNYRPRKKRKKSQNRTTRLQTIAFLSNKPSAVFASPIYTRLLEYIEDICRRNDARLVVHFGTDTSGLNVDGIFFLGTYSPQIVETVQATPTVKIMGTPEPAIPCDTVTDFKEYRAAISSAYFDSIGCDAIFTVANQESELRYTPSGIPLLHPFRIYRNDSFIIDYSQVRQCVRTIMQRSSDYHTVGIYCVDDAILTQLHWELYHTCEEHGQSRDKFHLLCQNYSELEQALLDPPPAFLHVHEDEIVRAAFDQLLLRIDDPAMPHRIIQVVPTIVAPSDRSIPS